MGGCCARACCAYVFIAPAVCSLLPGEQRLYGFEAAKYGLSDAEAAEIATVFTAYDADE